jgi:hypothetical protein
MGQPFALVVPAEQSRHGDFAVVHLATLGPPVDLVEQGVKYRV